jgi:N4-gp56 family major capsid protein
MAAMTLSSLTDLQKTDYVREGLPNAKPKLLYAQYAVKDRVAKREGKTRQWFRMTKPGLTSQSGDFSGTTYQYVKNTTGASPTWTPATAADTTVTAQADFIFGQGHEWNDGMEYMSFADIPKELRALNFMHAGEAIDTEVRSVVTAGTNVIYANARTTRPNILSTDTVDMADFFSASTNLRNSDAPEIQGMYSAIVSANRLFNSRNRTSSLVRLRNSTESGSASHHVQRPAPTEARHLRLLRLSNQSLQATTPTAKLLG